MKGYPWNAVRVFASVYKNGGIRAAARDLGIAHSSVSRHLTELSTWLGVPLTEQTQGRRALIFTPHGKKLGQTALTSLQNIQHTVSALREARIDNSVTISSAPSFASRWLLPRIPELEDAHPEIESSVLVDQRILNLDDHDIDLAIRIGSGPWPETHYQALMDDWLYPVMSPSFWERSGKPTNAKQLAGLRLLHDRDPHATWEIWRQMYGPAALNIRNGPRFASSDLVLRASLQGQGVALARHQLAADDVRSGALIRPFQEAAIHLRDAYWIILSRRSCNRASVKTIVKWLIKQGLSSQSAE